MGFASAQSVNAAAAGTTTTTVVITYNDPRAAASKASRALDPATFGTDDITVDGGRRRVTGFSVSGNQVTYTVRSPAATWGASKAQGTYTGLGRREFRQGSGWQQTSPRALNIGTFFVDTVPPTATLTSPPTNINAASGGGSTNTFTVTYNDATSGIDFTTVNSNDFVVSNVSATVTLLRPHRKHRHLHDHRAERLLGREPARDSTRFPSSPAACSTLPATRSPATPISPASRCKRFARSQR